jgi:hypothetical protein
MCRVGSSLKILGAYDLCDKVALRSFLITCQTKVSTVSNLFHFSGILEPTYINVLLIDNSVKGVCYPDSVVYSLCIW